MAARGGYDRGTQLVSPRSLEYVAAGAAVMFPIVVANGGDPSETAIAIWGLTLATLGAVLWLPATATTTTTSASVDSLETHPYQHGT